MKARKNLYGILLLLFFLLPESSLSKCYYVSEKGSDQNNGLSSRTPWRTLQKVQAQLHLVHPGDSILFEKGSMFYGALTVQQSGTTQKRIFIGAYGTGTLPVIKGSITISGWEPVGKNIWKTLCKDCTSRPGGLYINSKEQSLARYPDSGYRHVRVARSSGTQFEDRKLNFDKNHWQGAEVVAKTSRWTLDVLPVQSFTDNTFLFKTSSSYPFPADFDYFIQNHVAALNLSGEWMYNPQTQEIFLYYENLDPNKATIEVSWRDCGLKVSHAAFVTINNLSFEWFREAGVIIENSRDINFSNNSISCSGVDGLRIVSVDNIIVSHNRISDSHNNGVTWTGNTNGSFTWNSVFRTGLQPGRGSSGNGTYIALYITGKANTRNIVQYNTIDSTGYSAIDFRTGNTYVANNVIRHFCLLKDDGGGIYSWENDEGNNVIEKNIVDGEQTSANDGEKYVNGIYIDDRSKCIAISENTVVHCPGAGLVIHNARDLLVDRNKLVGNGKNFLNKEKVQLLIRRDGIVPEEEFDDLNLGITGNVFACEREDQDCVMIDVPAAGLLPGRSTFLNNYYAYFDPYTIIVRYSGSISLCNASRSYTLQQWKEFSANDVTSGEKRLASSSFHTTTTLHPKNGSSQTTTGWMTWPGNSSLRVDSNQDIMSVEPAPGEQVLLYHEGFTLDRKKIYQLSFVVEGLHDGEIEFVPLLNDAPWTAVGDYHCFKMTTVARTITCYFKPTFTSHARLNFKSNQVFRLSHIILREVTIADECAELRLVYNANHSNVVIKLGNEYFHADGSPAGTHLVIVPYDAALLFRAQKRYR